MKQNNSNKQKKKGSLKKEVAEHKLNTNTFLYLLKGSKSTDWQMKVNMFI